MSTEGAVYGGLLVAATFWAVLSAVLLLGAPYEGDRGATWFWGAAFAGSSLASALCFWELLGVGV